MLEALERRWLSAAVLDVFKTEPLPAADALWASPNVYITPHVSAVSFPTDVAEIFLRNLEHRLAGRQMEFVIDWDQGY